MIEYIKGDLIQMAEQGELDAIAHGCNCFCMMGSGIAVAMRRFTNDECIRVDVENGRSGDINKLGKFTKCEAKGVTVYNLYTQYTVAGMHENQSGVFVNWDLAGEALLMAVTDAMSKHGNHVRFGIPLIGCGLAGGERKDFDYMLEQIKIFVPSSVNIKVVEFG